MKSLLFVSMLLMSTSAFAEVFSEIQNLSKFEVVESDKGQVVNVGYTVGGGCQPHKTELKVDLVTEGKSLVALITVLDVTPEPDFCEAMKYMEASINIKDLIKKALVEQGVQAPWSIVVRLNSTFRIDL